MVVFPAHAGLIPQGTFVIAAQSDGIPRSRGVDSGTTGSPVTLAAGIPRSRGVDSASLSWQQGEQWGIPRSRGVDSDSQLQTAVDARLYSPLTRG